MNSLLEQVGQLTRKAGAAIMEVYDREDFSVATKEDASPLTAADLAAHQVIVDGLQALAGDIPVLSEESDEIPFSERQSWNRYFLVDPLDGTKEFINRNGEFTVNIALIENHRPVLGAVFVPVQDVLYLGDVKAGVALVERAGASEQIHCRSLDSDSVTIVASRRHGNETMDRCLEVLQARFEVETINVGSSLKFCMLAEGRADLYPRLAPTSEWDTAAAQAVVESAGGRVTDQGFDPLQYNTKENILNPFFYVVADSAYDWEGALADVPRAH